MIKRALFSLVLLLFSLSSTFWAQDNNQYLFPIKVSGKSGFIDQSGKIVIPLQFDEVLPFEDGIAIVEKDGKAGAIDKNGAVVIENKFDIILSFSEGLAAFYDSETDFWGFIDKKGNIVVEPKFYEVGSFSEGLCPVATQKLSIERKIDSSEIEIEEILIWSCLNSKAEYTFQNLSVKINQRKFKNGLLPVFDLETKKYGYINQEGDYEIDPIFYTASPFSEELACVSNEYYQYGYIDKDGNYVIEPRYIEALSFSEGLAAVKNNEDKWGYINKDGIYVIPPSFEGYLYEGDFVRNFSEGLASYAEKGKCGYIDKTGKQVLPPQWDRAEDFINGLAEVYQRISIWNEDKGSKDDPEAYEMIDSFLGYINKEGVIIWKQPEE